MAVPSWSTAMISNYRAMFKAKYNEDSKLTDEVIWAICNEVFDDSSNTNEANERVSEMFLREHGRHEGSVL